MPKNPVCRIRLLFAAVLCLAVAWASVGEAARSGDVAAPLPSLQADGAGWIGGLMLVEDTHVTSATTTLSAPVYDGHGNVIGLVDMVTGAVVAQYAVGPFGEPMATGGAVDRLDDCPFRFSTKYLDEETGLYYYGYRYYEPKTGSWLSRDPLGEEGGLNLYGFVENDPVNAWDYLGLNRLVTVGVNDQGKEIVAWMIHGSLAVVLDDSGNFITGWKLKPGTPQFEKFIKDGFLK